MKSCKLKAIAFNHRSFIYTVLTRTDYKSRGSWNNGYPVPKLDRLI